MNREANYLFSFFGIINSFINGSKNQLNLSGVAFDYSPPRSGIYIGSPGIAILPGGDYVVSHDFIGPNSTPNLMRLFRSKDKGFTWQKLTNLQGQFWSSLFMILDDPYILGTSRLYGFVVIRRFQDGGKT